VSGFTKKTVRKTKKKKAPKKVKKAAERPYRPEFYITTAIPYVNAKPHIGHALEFVQTDVIKRFQQLQGRPAFLTTGADENSLKNVQAAEAEGVTTQQLCDKNAAIFKDFAQRIGLSFDSFIRSSSRTDHWPGVVRLWNLCNKAGVIYKKKYKGLYCVGCEAFYKESELKDGLCPEHNKPPVVVEEENYFFRLSKFQKKLEKLIKTGELQVVPTKRKNEVLAFLKEGLEDFSISRSVERAHGWGVPVPGDDTQIMYVWFDALSCYLTGVGWGFDNKNKAEKFRKWWPADIHVIGKGITRFHAIYWPAMLMAAELPTPRTVFVHGYVTVEGQKMSKSLGNVVDPIRLIDRFSPDAVRYYLINEIPAFDDGDFSEARLIEKTNNELIGNFGNFVFRVLSFLKANFNSVVPEPGKLDAKDRKIIESVSKAKEAIKADMEKLNMTEALHKALELSKEGNRYFQEKKPWESMKRDHDDAANTLYVSTNVVRSLAVVFWPFVPFACESLWEQLRMEGKVCAQLFDDADKLLLSPGHRIGDIKPLFKKIED
jgi:methionyl-tRNA synthetase